MTDEELINNFRRAGQGQVFAFLDRLTEEGRRRLLADAAEIDLAEVEELHRKLVAKRSEAGIDLEGLSPAPYQPLPDRGGDEARWNQARAAGEAALRAGRVAAFTVAGGQGTRLGFDGPKGTFPVTPVKRKPLFQIFSEKIQAAERRFGRALHWFIMTSHQNHADTVAFFSEHRHFGLDAGRVHFFRQGRMPVIDFEGKILLEAPDSIALSPDGHGGALRALDRSGALDLMRAEGITALSYFQVDNPLVRCIDPAFVGWHLLQGSEMSSKTVLKAYPEEKLGLFCLRREQLAVVEYSDLPMAMQRESDSEGRLRHRAGSIAVHLFDREFITRMAKGGGLEFHRADKKVPAIDADGRPMKPEKPNAVKFELFVFDALPFAKNPLVIETDRADEFSPVKNAEGVRFPRSCRDDQLRQAARWLKAGGAGVPTDASGVPEFAVEISPLFAADAAEFSENWSRLSPKPAVADGLYLS